MDAAASLWPSLVVPGLSCQVSSPLATTSFSELARELKKEKYCGVNIEEPAWLRPLHIDRQWSQKALVQEGPSTGVQAAASAFSQDCLFPAAFV